MLLDQYGRPLAVVKSEPQLTGGWRVSGGLDTQVDPANIYGVDRTTQRRASRVAYFSNALLHGALNVVLSYIVGDAFAYADLEDTAAQEALEELFAHNDLGVFTERLYLEYLIDGESALILADDPGPDAPSRLALVDVDKGIKLEYNSLEGVTAMTIPLDRGRTRTLYPESFVWHAHNALFNDPRGWPVVMQAVGPALSYVTLLNHRLRQHDIQSRINAVYHALIDYSGGVDSVRKQIATKSSLWGKVPRDGAVVTLAKDVATGNAETFEFTKPTTQGASVEEDARLIRLMVAVALGLPEHYLGEGGNANRATATVMGDPARRQFLRRQGTLRSILDRIYRLELLRRYGEGRTYQVTEFRNRGYAKERVRVTREVDYRYMYVPWTFPDVSTDDLGALVEKVRVASEQKLASRETRQGWLGLDPALEAERLANENDPALRAGRPAVGEPKDEGADDGES